MRLVLVFLTQVHFAVRWRCAQTTWCPPERAPVLYTTPQTLAVVAGFSQTPPRLPKKDGNPQRDLFVHINRWRVLTFDLSCTEDIPRGGVVDFLDVASDNVQILVLAWGQQPSFTAIQADQFSFSFSSGALTATCGACVDHGLFAVGFGTDAGTDSWKVSGGAS